MKGVQKYLQSIEDPNLWAKYTFSSHPLPRDWGGPEMVTLTEEDIVKMVEAKEARRDDFLNVAQFANGLKKLTMRTVRSDSTGKRTEEIREVERPRFVVGLNEAIHGQVKCYGSSNKEDPDKIDYHFVNKSMFNGRNMGYYWQTSTRHVMYFIEELAVRFWQGTEEVREKLDHRSKPPVYYRMVKRTYKMFVDACHFYGWDAWLTHITPEHPELKSWYVPHVLVNMGGLQLEFEWDFFNYEKCCVQKPGAEKRPYSMVKEFNNGVFVDTRSSYKTLKWYKKIIRD